MSLHRPYVGPIEYDKHGYAIQELDFGTYNGLQRGCFKVWYRPGRLLTDPQVLDRALTRKRAKEIKRAHRRRIMTR